MTWPAIDMTGERFHRLVVEGVSHKKIGARMRRQIVCRCDCGSPVVTERQFLVNGRVKSCGCLRAERTQAMGNSNVVHGMTGSPTWNSWSAMLHRCTNPNAHAYERYGGRGIAVCERWRESFENFLADMGERPAGRTIDRFPNNDGNYEPENCRWATPLQQRQNQSPRRAK